MLSWHPTESAKCFALMPGIADEANFRGGVALLGRHDRLLELMLYPYQAPGLALLARDFNHCGSRFRNRAVRVVSHECAASAPNR